ncbi:MAG: MOSC domain-containing protein [Anaerolineales bacterium]
MITLASLIYYPIKACRGFEVDETDVERMGLADDRRMMAVTPEGGFLTQREHPRLALVTPTISGQKLTLSAPDIDSLTISIRKSGPTRSVDIWHSQGVQAVDQGELAAEWFSDWLGTPVRLVHIAEGYIRKVSEKYAINPDDHTAFADGYPILLTSEESLEDLNARLETPVPMNRFRPNMVVKGCEPFAEDTWSRICIGDTELAIVKPCARCVVTTIDKETLAKSKEPLKTLASYRTWNGGAMFGQNVIPLNEGRIRLGMNVKILS